MGNIPLLFCGFVILLISVLYLLEKRKRSYFESKGIPYSGNGTVRLILNTFRGIGIHEDLLIQYKKFKDLKYKIVGSSDFGKQTLYINDPALIRLLLVKDFDHFVDRRPFTFPKEDKIFKKMIFFITGEKWKALRSKLSPTFTTGKIKRLFHLFNESGKKLVSFWEKEMIQSVNGEINLEEGYSKFAMDIIASAACGMDSKAFDQKEPSVFEDMGKKMQSQLSAKALLKIILLLVSPWITEKLGVSFFDQEAQGFFSGAIKASIHDRKEKGEKREDFIQLMLEARQGKLKTEESELDSFEKDAKLNETDAAKSETDASVLLDDDVIVGNAVLFMLAGYDTTQSLLLFSAYTLALNPSVQDKLREELDRVLEEKGGDFIYESLNSLHYLDMVINETLRFYPPAAGLDRSCTQDYKIPGTDFVLKKGNIIAVNTMGMQRDPDYFEDPDTFNPDRFAPENKHKLNLYAFLPFGTGPRNCIGMRFALTEVKVAIAHLVHNFKLEPSKSTLIPMEFARTGTTKPKGGMFLALHKIQH